MQLRNLTIPYAQPAVFAPMAGFTDAACRHLMADHGAAWTVSEMASAKAITFGDDKSVRLLRDKAPHGIYAVQLFGAEPETMAQAIRIIQEKGVQFDILDINMGCPAPKITSSGAGSKLMQDPELCGRMVAAARGALGPDKPLTVKMRIGWDAEQLTGVAVARQCEANGADLIAVHGRTREQMYIPPIDVDAITEIRKAVGIPVLANGDITTAEDAKQILEQTGCAGVMIGRGALGNPWIFESLARAWAAGVFDALRTEAQGTEANRQGAAGARAAAQDTDLSRQGGSRNAAGAQPAGAAVKVQQPGAAADPALYNCAPSKEEKIAMMLRHFDDVYARKGEYTAVREMRKHVGWYLKGVPGAAAFRGRINQINDAAALRAAIRSI